MDETDCVGVTSRDLENVPVDTRDLVEIFVDSVFVAHENYPFHYENNQHKRQTFTTGPDMVFMIRFEFFHLETDRTTAQCADYLEIKNGLL